MDASPKDAMDFLAQIAFAGDRAMIIELIVTALLFGVSYEFFPQLPFPERGAYGCGLYFIARLITVTKQRQSSKPATKNAPVKSALKATLELSKITIINNSKEFRKVVSVNISDNTGERVYHSLERLRRIPDSVETEYIPLNIGLRPNGGKHWEFLMYTSQNPKAVKMIAYVIFDNGQTAASNWVKLPFY